MVLPFTKVIDKKRNGYDEAEKIGHEKSKSQDNGRERRILLTGKKGV